MLIFNEENLLKEIKSANEDHSIPSWASELATMIFQQKLMQCPKARRFMYLLVSQIPFKTLQSLIITDDMNDKLKRFAKIVLAAIFYLY